MARPTWHTPFLPVCLAAVLFSLVAAWGCHAATPAGPSLSETAKAASPPSELLYVFANFCERTIWVGQHNDAGPVTPTIAWSISPSCDQNSDCPSNNCFQSQCVCSATESCPGGAECVGGTCPTSTIFQIPVDWQSGTFWGRTGCTASGSDFNCVTGQCGDPGQLVCPSTGGTPIPPVSQFEVTSTLINGGTSANYDLSLVAGYNLPMVTVPTGGNHNGGPCSMPQCNADLRASCPAPLQYAKTFSTCDASTCPGGLCVDSSTCVYGCFDPCTRCQRPSPPTALRCDDQVDNLTFTDCQGQSHDVTYEDLYCAKNTHVNNGHSMASVNQGTPTCFADVDCPDGLTCWTKGFPSGHTPPTGSGVCLDPADPVDWKGPNITCSSANIGTPCGGYLQDYSPTALGYTCQPVQVSSTVAAHLCLPPVTSGVGTCVAPSGATPLYTGVGGVFNQAWVDAATAAGGGTTPYYVAYHQACPNAYAWQYDDAVGGYACGGLTGFVVGFCYEGDPRELVKHAPR